MPPAAPAPGMAAPSPSSPAKVASAVSSVRTSSGRRALLRPEHGGGAVGPEQRGGHVAQQANAAGGASRSAGAVDAREPRELAAPVAERTVVGVEQPHPERRQGAGAAVGGGRAAEADDERACAGVEGRRDDLAEAAGRRAERVGRRHEGETGGLRQLDDGGAVGQREPVAGGRAAVRPGDVARGSQHRLRDRGRDRGERALAAVGLRQQQRASSPGRTDRQPSAIAVATSAATSEPLKESGAITTRSGIRSG